MLNERQLKIAAYLTEHTKAKNSELLALAGNCSSMTLWRDLEKLEKEGYIVRIRGGAASTETLRAPGQESAFTDRATQNLAEKKRLARIAAGLLHANHAYYLDAGSTVLALTHLLGEAHYNIVTSAANTAVELSRRKGCNVTLLGGQLYGSTLACSGPQAEAMLDEINIDIAVIATSGFSLACGLTSGYLPEARVKRKVIQKAAFTMLLMDHSKIGQNQAFTFAQLGQIDALICDRPLPPELCDAAELAGTLVFSPEDGRTEEERDALCRRRLGEKAGRRV